jgi:hypothetical protein
MFEMSPPVLFGMALLVMIAAFLLLDGRAAR